MKMIISHNLRKIAEFLIFAQNLDQDDISGLLEGFESIAESKDNFEPDDSRLTLSDKGLSMAKTKLKNLPIEKVKGQTITRMFIKLLEAIETSAKFNKDIKTLAEYLKGPFPYPWNRLEKTLSNMRPEESRREFESLVQQSLSGISALVKSDS